MVDRKNTIYLIGFSGSGKTTIGKLLAKNMKMNFFDTDEEIVKSCKKEISDIFKDSGEKYFRALEKQILQIVTMNKSLKKIVSLGGGVFQDKENRRFIQQNGVSIYLSCSQKEIYRRMKDKRDRPLLLGRDGRTYTSSVLKEKIRKMVQQRKPNYVQADVIVSTTHKTKNEIVKLIRNKLKSYAGH